MAHVFREREVRGEVGRRNGRIQRLQSHTRCGFKRCWSSQAISARNSEYSETVAEEELHFVCRKGDVLGMFST